MSYIGSTELKNQHIRKRKVVLESMGNKLLIKNKKNEKFKVEILTFVPGHPSVRWFKNSVKTVFYKGNIQC